MKATAQIFPVPRSQPDLNAQATASGRNLAIDTMRGIAILMVVAIHSLQQPLDSSWQVLVDAALRPCVPMFLFASGYLTALSGRVPLAKRIKAALIPYAIAFVAAYIYMSLQNPAMDHRLTTTVARFILAYVFVYYYVFVYVGCTLCLWLVLRFSGAEAPPAKPRLVVFLMLSIAFGLIAGSYLDPLLTRLGFSGPLIEEVRMRDIPFWFSFAAVGALVAQLSAGRPLRDMRWTIAGAVLTAYAIYAAVRLFGIGDAADYDSVAFFGYAATLCVLLFALDIQLPFVAALGSGSYFIYLWHIFIVMALRDQAALRQYGAAIGSGVIYMVTVAASILALLAVRRFCPPRLVRWLGA
jgi:surface polysaccharide O-acyltransferase-like enzyme